MLLLDTVNKTTIWGGTRLQKFGADPLNTRVGSLYTVAGNEELTCTVLNGEFIGMTLHEVYAADPARFGCPQFPVFPLLIGLVDAAQDLSIQVHPGDAYARERLGAPFILKIPDGSFSVGMHKVASDEELRAALDEMFRHSSVLLAQEFIPTEFDWRIGLLDGEPLFACKYYMAKGHWQIYNHAHDDTGRNLCGAWETVPIYKAPQKVLDTAVKAAALIGKGLYGVDLKLINGRAVVIEINDNPSIDHEVEDAVLGDELYYRILNHFVHCLNRLHAQ